MLASNFMIISIPGQVLTEDLKDKLLSLQPAGVIIFDKNISSREQVKELTVALKDLLGDDLIISIDQEGGKVERLRKISPSIPSSAALGRAAQQDANAILLHTQALAEDLIDLGFNYSYSPCADLATNPHNPIIGSRSLGHESKLVSKQLQEIIKTYKFYGLKTCAKHFPGHGDASLDSHFALPKIKFTKGQIKQHLEPFEACIKSGVDSIMIAHLALDIDPNFFKELGILVDESLASMPSSMSHTIVTKLLREYYGYEGLIISDDISMKALSGSNAEKCKRLWGAGIDLVIANLSLDEIEQVNEDLSEFNPGDKQERVNQFKNFMLTSLEPCDSYSEMLNIVNQAIELDLDSALKSDLQQAVQNQAIELWYIPHPKLESEIIDFISRELQVVCRSVQADSQASANTLSILLYFPQARQKLLDVDIKVSLDQYDAQAVINLYGANAIHLQGLMNYLQQLG